MSVSSASFRTERDAESYRQEVIDLLRATYPILPEIKVGGCIVNADDFYLNGRTPTRSETAKLAPKIHPILVKLVRATKSVLLDIPEFALMYTRGLDVLTKDWTMDNFVLLIQDSIRQTALGFLGANKLSSSRNTGCRVYFNIAIGEVKRHGRLKNDFTEKLTLQLRITEGSFDLGNSDFWLMVATKISSIISAGNEAVDFLCSMNKYGQRGE